MPRGKAPPTPADSTGPTPKDKSMHEMETSFVLPSAALKPSPPASPVLTRKRTLSGGPKAKDELPPPPSRARKIIQMKPKEEPTNTSPNNASTGAGATMGNSTISASTKTNTSNNKRKQPSATSAAGRKIARKTAHSIIERRRRSKMNEEFGVLKDMIPACKGVEMHKLAILQAGIEYVRYLQGCVEKLQDREQADVPFQVRRRHIEDEDEDDDDNNENEEDEDGVEEMDHDARESREDQTHAQRSSSLQNAHRNQRQGSLTTTATLSTHPSPALRPNLSSSSLASQSQNHNYNHSSSNNQTQRSLQLAPSSPANPQKVYSTSPPPLPLQTPSHTGVSPAFNAVHFSPDLSRTYSHTTFPAMIGGKPSPNILPLPQAAMPISGLSMTQMPLSASLLKLGGGGGGASAQGQGQGQGHTQQVAVSGDGHAEATATAALMMMGNDRRGNGGTGKGGGMSVRDLLSH